ncbi:hypothetical protein RCH09_001896 [Actimicrobium sp. GrIS 1.19]|uniref:hypothetical protein n=1 Tax=Actimicrobium sp. GrIS 1.19 TaxID=3071708 RepID=UPI002E005387|nr:hypothetical protein [Actimicrobium sp. GrIS 1.19]
MPKVVVIKWEFNPFNADSQTNTAFLFRRRVSWRTRLALDESRTGTVLQARIRNGSAATANVEGGVLGLATARPVGEEALFASSPMLARSGRSNRIAPKKKG